MLTKHPLPNPQPSSSHKASCPAAGFLIYVATVEMLAGDFVMDREMWRSGLVRQGVALGSVVGGVVGMAVIG